MNMRKIIAILSAALLLCAAIPMGALSVAAAPGDVIIDADFNDGMDGFTNHSVIDGALVIDGTSADWANSFIYAGFKPGVKYQVTFSAKADAPQSLAFKINNGWAGTNVSASAALTTEYAEYELFLTPDANLVEPIFTIQTNTEAPNGTIFYIDWVKVVEYKEPTVPGKIVNGDFETGDATGWNLPQQGGVSAEAAHDGSYGVNIKGSGSYGGMLDQTIPAEAGKTYEISFWLKVNANGVNFQIKDGDTSGADIASDWFDMNKAGNWSQFSFIVTPTTDLLTINFCGAGNGNAEDAYVDSVVVTEKKGVWSIDFNDGVNSFSSSALVAEGPDGTNCLKWSAAGGWSSTWTYAGVFKANTDYTVTFKAKASVSGGMGITIEDGGWGSYTNVPGFNVTTEWADYAVTFNTANHPNANGTILFKFQDVGVAMDLYVDDIVIAEGLPEQPEQPEQPAGGLIVNGDFEDGQKNWTNLWGSSTVEIVEGRNGGSALKGTGNGAYHIVYQEVAVTPNTDYTVSAYSKNAVGADLWIKSEGGAANIDNKSFNSGSDWAVTSITFNSGDNHSVWVGLMALNAGSTYIVDDITMAVAELTYIVNGDFETGEVSPWDNLWGSCPTVEIVEGMDGGYGLHIVSGQWQHVRQAGISVKPNTWYKVSGWAKNTNNMCLLVKDGDDKVDIINKGISAGDEWVEFSGVFNSGDYTAVIVSLMGGAGADQYGIFDNIVMEITEAPCEHNYELTDGIFPTCETEGSATYTCSICGDVKTETLPAYHNGGMEYNPAKEAIDCANPGNIENYYCPGCNEYFADAHAQEIINPWYIEITVDCVKPEGLADCAGWTCETCGNENFGSGAHDVVVCQGGICSKCNAEIEGYGCSNSTTPACEDGVCDYCGGFVAGFGHENGAWAPCLDGECVYSCGLQYPATEDHVDADADDYCDNCWNHLACIDEDGNGECDVCWSPMPAADIVYGDANGDGEIDSRDIALLQQYNIGWEVALDETAADVNGDGEIDSRDIALLQQYNIGWDVVLGPQG